MWGPIINLCGIQSSLYVYYVRQSSTILRYTINSSLIYVFFRTRFLLSFDMSEIKYDWCILEMTIWRWKSYYMNETLSLCRAVCKYIELHKSINMFNLSHLHVKIIPKYCFPFGDTSWHKCRSIFVPFWMPRKIEWHSCWLV